MIASHTPYMKELQKLYELSEESIGKRNKSAESEGDRA